jgi:hypothetical protein
MLTALGDKLDVSGKGRGTLKTSTRQVRDGCPFL